MNRHTSTLLQLRLELQSIEEDLAKLVTISPVEWFDRDSDSVVFIGWADYDFAKPSADQLRLQLPLKARYDKWLERFRLLYRNPPSDLQENIDQAHEILSKWIDLGSSNYEIGSDPVANAIAARKACEPFFKLLDLLEGSREIIIVPDTNALIAESDPIRYQAISGSSSFTFLLLPTVLAELDNLKNFARDPSFRDKVGNVVRRIKGWRNQGSLHEGVTLHQTIRIRAIAEEPDVRGTLSWLDPSNRDDRIIASTLGVQMLAPSAQVVLVTGDINLQNKAEAAKLPYADLP